jgi:hypothetical protein
MKKHFFCLILLGMVAGCTKNGPATPPEGVPEAQANLESFGGNDQSRKAKSDSRNQGGGKDEAVENGVLHDRFDFVSFLINPDNPEEYTCVLREKGEGNRAKFRAVKPFDEIQGGPGISAFVESADPYGVTYIETADDLLHHRLRRSTTQESLAMPAQILASFIGGSTGLPVLYDGRTGYATRTVRVAASEPTLDVGDRLIL